MLPGGGIGPAGREDPNLLCDSGTRSTAGMVTVRSNLKAVEGRWGDRHLGGARLEPASIITRATVKHTRGRKKTDRWICCATESPADFPRRAEGTLRGVEPFWRQWFSRLRATAAFQQRGPGC